jgi:hypothetical protein
MSPSPKVEARVSPQQNTVSFMQMTTSALKKKIKIKQKFKPGVEIKIHQHMSISIRKYRYFFEREKTLPLFGSGVTMKKIFYIQFKQEIISLIKRQIYNINITG